MAIPSGREQDAPLGDVAGGSQLGSLHHASAITCATGASHGGPFPTDNGSAFYSSPAPDEPLHALVSTPPPLSVPTLLPHLVIALQLTGKAPFFGTARIPNCAADRAATSLTTPSGTEGMDQVLQHHNRKFC